MMHKKWFTACGSESDTSQRLTGFEFGAHHELGISGQSLPESDREATSWSRRVSFAGQEHDYQINAMQMGGVYQN